MNEVLARRGFLGGMGAVLSGGLNALTGYDPNPPHHLVHGESILPKIGRLRYHLGHLPLPRFSIRSKIIRKVDTDSTFGVMIYVDPAGVTEV